MTIILDIILYYTLKSNETKGILNEIPKKKNPIPCKDVIFNEQDAST